MKRKGPESLEELLTTKIWVEEERMPPKSLKNMVREGRGVLVPFKSRE